MHLRIARHSRDLQKLEDFYTNILKLEVLGKFVDHQGYDGLFLGRQDAEWHLEFTASAEEPVHEFDDDDLLVFYPTEGAEYDELVESINRNAIPKLLPKNPYWNKNGIMIADPDGFKIVISNVRSK